MELYADIHVRPLGEHLPLPPKGEGDSGGTSFSELIPVFFMYKLWDNSSGKIPERMLVEPVAPSLLMGADYKYEL